MSQKVRYEKPWFCILFRPECSFMDIIFVAMSESLVIGFSKEN